MVRALFAGTKTQTRRVVKVPPIPSDRGLWEATTLGGKGIWLDRACTIEAPERPAMWHTRTCACVCCPYGVPGDRLWVRETQWVDTTTGAFLWFVNDVFTPDRKRDNCKLRPGIFMPRADSRITLEVTGVRVQRVQEISEADVDAEGTSPMQLARGVLRADWKPQQAYSRLWDSLNAKRGHGWSTNPWVWAIAFRRLP